MRDLIKLAVGAVFIVGISIGLWMAGRYISYALMYESLVQQTVTEMVKPEALK